MKSKYLFWVLLALLFVVLGLVYVLKVQRTAQRLSEKVALLNTLSASASTKAPHAVGRKELAEMTEMQNKVRDDVLRKLQASFERRDADNLDLWFPDLKTPWKSSPRVEPFQRQYELARDRLTRETARYLAEQGVKNVSTALLSYESLTNEAYNSKEERARVQKEMRRRQREFWVQDRLARLFARVGAWLSRPIKGGESSGIAANGVSSAAFERTRYDVRVRVKSERLQDALHALDAPVTLHSEDGGLLVIALSAVVDNNAIRSLDLDLPLVQKWEGEPPVEVSFYLTILDYHERKKH